MAKAWCIIIEMIGILWGGFKEMVAILVAFAVVLGMPIAIIYFGAHWIAQLLDTTPQAVIAVPLCVLALGCVIDATIDLYCKANEQCQ